MGVAGEFRLCGALKGRLNEGLALGAAHKAPARDCSRSLGELGKGKVPIASPNRSRTGLAALRIEAVEQRLLHHPPFAHHGVSSRFAVKVNQPHVIAASDFFNIG